MFKLPATCFAILLCFSACKKIAKTTSTSDYYRVPGDIIPLSYDLKIIPDFRWFNFSGKVSIKIFIKFRTNIITLHCSDKLKIKATSAMVDFQEGDAGIHHENDILTLVMRDALPRGGIYTLTFHFEGVMNNTMRGLYKISYEDDGKQKWLAATHFIETYAREVFPCFDEPYFRTPFDIYVARYPNQTTIAKYPQTNGKEEPNNEDFEYNVEYEWDHYEITDAIPTHLASFIVSELHCSCITNPSHMVKLWTRNIVRDYTAYALQQSEKALIELEIYTSIPHELPHLHIVVVPETDEEVSQNWGITMLTETHIIVDEEQKSSDVHKTLVTSALCNTISRHWLGGFVTPVNWDYAWLTGALAGYMELILTPMVEPSLKIDEIFNVRMLQPALWFEMMNQRPLTRHEKSSVSTDNESEFIDHFKGTSIIRMLEHIISKNSIKSVIKKYIEEGRKMNLGLISPHTFYKALEYQAQIHSFPLPHGISITEIMKTWTENAGYPLITVSRDVKNNILTIQQSAYTSPLSSKLLFDREWIIPISYTTKSEAQFSNTFPSVWSVRDKLVHITSTIDENEWIICNVQQTGYYRVNYDSHNWNLLIKQLKQQLEKIHYLNRVQLIDDSFSLAFDDRLSYEIPLKIGEYLHQENEILPLIRAIFHFDVLLKKYKHVRVCIYIYRYIKPIIETHINRIGFEVKDTDNYVTKIGRHTLLSFACEIGLGACAQGMFLEYQNNIEDIDKITPDLKEIVFCTILRRADNSQEVYNKLWLLYRRSNIAYNKKIILNALGCTQNEELIKKTLNKLIKSENEEMTKLDKKNAYNAILSTHNGVLIFLKFIKELIPTISNLNDDSITLLKTMVNQLESKTTSESQVTMLKMLENEFKRLDPSKYGDFVRSLRSARLAGIRRIKDNNERSEALIQIFTNILNT